MADRIIFLDVDGVICTGFSMRQAIDRGEDIFTGAAFHKPAVSCLVDLINSTQSKVVLSSTWRIGKTIEQLNQIFNPVGIDIYDKTPTFRSGTRGSEVQDWLSRHEGQVSSFVILDDDIFDIINEFPNNTVEVNRDSGLSESEYDVALHILTKIV